MHWTGERFVPGAGGAQIFYEHAHRYLLAASLASGRAVVDLASGEGYGAAWLARRAVSVTGVDAAGDAVAHASAKYGGPGLRFVRGDLRAVPLTGGCAGLVTCFEAIEHVDDHEVVVAEIDRLLGADGIAIVSTPDATTYGTGAAPNPFHVHELTVPEFLDLLRPYFSHVTLLGQRVLPASVMWPLSESTASGLGPVHVTTPALDGHDLGLPGLAPVYVVAVCARQRTAALDGLTTSLLVDRDETLIVEYWEELAARPPVP